MKFGGLVPGLVGKWGARIMAVGMKKTAGGRSFCFGASGLGSGVWPGGISSKAAGGLLNSIIAQFADMQYRIVDEIVILARSF